VVRSSAASDVYKRQRLKLFKVNFWRLSRVLLLFKYRRTTDLFDRRQMLASNIISGAAQPLTSRYKKLVTS
jgi:hypothetical protein